MRWIACWLAAALLACQPMVELDFVRPAVQAPAVLAARCLNAGPLALELGLIALPSWWALTPADRVQVGAGVVRLADLTPGSFKVSNLGAVTTLSYLARPRPRHLALVLDSSEAAAQWDPDDQRLVMARQLVGSLRSMCSSGLSCDTRLSLLAMRDGAVKVLASESSDLDEIVGLLNTSDELLLPLGRAPLHDAVVEAARLLGQQTAGSSMIVLYWGSMGDGESSATQDQARAVAAKLPVLVVQGPGAAESPVVGLAAAGQGLLLPAATPSEVAEASAGLTSALSGVWRLELDRGCGADEVVAGGLELILGPNSKWSRSFRLPLLRR